MKKFTLLLLAAVLCGSAFAQNRVKNVYTFSSRLNVAELQIPNQTVQLNRTLLAGYNTLCLPMSLSAEALQAAAEGVQIERLAAIRQEGATLCLYFLDCTEDGMEAGQPYLIFSPKTQNVRASTANARFVATELVPITMSDSQGNRVTFTSSWSSLAFGIGTSTTVLFPGPVITICFISNFLLLFEFGLQDIQFDRAPGRGERAIPSTASAMNAIPASPGWEATPACSMTCAFPSASKTTAPILLRYFGSPWIDLSDT